MSTVAQRTHAWRCLLGDGLVVTGLTAAAIRRWWLPALPLEVPVFIAISEDDPRPRRVGLRVARHRASIPTTRLDGLDVATPAETMLASARHLSLLDLIILGDSALHSGDCTEQDCEPRLVNVGAVRGRCVERCPFWTPAVSHRGRRCCGSCTFLARSVSNRNS